MLGTRALLPYKEKQARATGFREKQRSFDGRGSLEGQTGRILEKERSEIRLAVLMAAFSLRDSS